MKKKKSPLVAALISAFAFPGLGQIYAKCYKKGFTIVILTIILFINIAVPLMQSTLSYISGTAALEDMGPVTYSSALTGTGTAKIKLFYILITLVWLYSIVDAWACAKRMNALSADKAENGAEESAKLEESSKQ